MTYPMSYDFRTGKLKKKERAGYMARLNSWRFRVKRWRDGDTVSDGDCDHELICQDQHKYSIGFITTGYRQTFTVTGALIREYRNTCRHRFLLARQRREEARQRAATEARDRRRKVWLGVVRAIECVIFGALSGLGCFVCFGWIVEFFKRIFA